MSSGLTFSDAKINLWFGRLLPESYIDKFPIF